MALLRASYRLMHCVTLNVINSHLLPLLLYIGDRSCRRRRRRRRTQRHPPASGKILLRISPLTILYPVVPCAADFSEEPPWHLPTTDMLHSLDRLRALSGRARSWSADAAIERQRQHQQHQQQQRRRLTGGSGFFAADTAAVANAGAAQSVRLRASGRHAVTTALMNDVKTQRQPTSCCD